MKLAEGYIINTKSRERGEAQVVESDNSDYLGVTLKWEVEIVRLRPIFKPWTSTTSCHYTFKADKPIFEGVCFSSVYITEEVDAEEALSFWLDDDGLKLKYEEVEAA